MPIPEMEESGYLPEGVHEATLEEVRDSRLDGPHAPGRAGRSPGCRSGCRRYEVPSPGGIPGRVVKIGLAGIDEVLVAGRIVDVVEDLLEIDPGNRIGREQRDRDDGQAPAQAAGPEPGAGSGVGPAAQHGVSAPGSILEGHRPAATQQVDLHEVGGTLEDLLARGKCCSRSLPLRLLEGLSSSSTVISSRP
jgi:hypothetical protein